MARRDKTPQSMNAFIVIGALYILGYLNPDTSDAFLWAGLVVATVISVAGLVWMIGRMVDRRKQPPLAEPAKPPLSPAEQRFQRRASEVAETERDSVGV
jgi:hypothetical protein